MHAHVIYSALALVLGLAGRGLAQQDPADARVVSWLQANGSGLDELYRHLHQNPELSFREVKTAARMAAELRAVGVEVTERVGGNGVVGVLRCGDGPVVLVRADMDGLPVAEETGLPYASKIRAESADGRAIGVMHACGHDIHMSCLIGVARYLAANKDAYSGTVVFQLQPAEERSGGMNRMLADGLLTRFPRPAHAIALHTAANQPVGQIGVRSGPAMANVDSCDITLYGRAGHGAAPHMTIDPVVQAAKLVLDLQTIVSREINPVDACVITVGSIHGGQKHNIISSSCHLQLTIRSYTEEVRRQMLEAIERKAKAAAMSVGAKEPTVKFSESTPALQNDEALTAAVRRGIAAILGAQNVVEIQPAMVAEDFGRLREQGVPLCMFRLGTIAPERLKKMQESGSVAVLHSGKYYPDYQPAIRLGVRALLAGMRSAAAR